MSEIGTFAGEHTANYMYIIVIVNIVGHECQILGESVSNGSRVVSRGTDVC